MGSGWPSGHVAIDWRHTYPDKPGGGEICLTTDSEDADELSLQIDELIAELEAIRAEAPQRFARWAADNKAQQFQKLKSKNKK